MKAYIKRIVSVIITSALVAGMICIIKPQTEVKAADAKVIPKGVTIAGTDFSGLNASEANLALMDMLKAYDDVNFTLVVEDEEINATGADIKIEPLNTDIIEAAINYGSRGNIIERFIAHSDLEAGKGKDFDLNLTCDWEKTRDFLEENGKALESAPVDHSIVREGGAFKLIEGHSGKAINVEESATIIANYITTAWQGEDASIDLSVELKEPKGSKEDLMAVKDLIGSFNTDYSGSSNARASNIKNGASKLNKSVIYPGEVFSVSTEMGSRNAENGYLPAPSYENGTTVDTYGGGVCQISSTLYNAIIRAELEIVERSPHSMIVSYVKPSMDAAISEGLKDLKFRNNKNYPIYIEGYTAGTVLYFNIYGKEERPSNRKVSYESEILATNEPKDQFVADASLPIGTVQRKQSAHTGYSARLWKIVTVNGNQESKEVFNSSSYRASNAIYAVGTASDNEEAKAAIAAALASQDKETINTAASAWSAEGLANRTEETNGENTESIDNNGNIENIGNMNNNPVTDNNANTTNNTISTPVSDENQSSGQPVDNNIPVTPVIPPNNDVPNAGGMEYIGDE